jgi:hypothetical protein
MKSGRWTILVIICMMPAFALAQEQSKSATATGVREPSVESSAARLGTGSTEEVVVLRAQITEMRRSEDRLLATVHWTLGAVVAIAVGLAAFSWWSSNKLHQQDLQLLKEDVHRQLSEVVERTLADSARKLEEAQRQEMNRLREEMHRLQDEMVAFTMWKVGALRLQSGDVDGAIDAAFEQESAARTGNSNLVTHAIIALADAFNEASARSLTLTPDKFESAHRLVLQSGDTFGEYGRKLKEALNRYSKTSAA